MLRKIFLIAVLSLLCYPCYGASNIIILTASNGTVWTVPLDFSSTNTIETWGGGTASYASGHGSDSGEPGGGGAYSAINNLSLMPGETVTIHVGSGGKTDAATGGDTYLCNSISNCASISGTAVQVGAKGAGINKSGGSSASGVGTVKYSGGSGFDGADAGGGGGAGPNGDGDIGSAGAGAGGSGGSGDNGSGGAGGGANNNGTSNVLGGGGGGGSKVGTPGNGGVPGGGGGADGVTYAVGQGGDGQIRITYAPAASNIIILNNAKINNFVKN